LRIVCSTEESLHGHLDSVDWNGGMELWNGE